jgi:hypothetical protein
VRGRDLGALLRIGMALLGVPVPTQIAQTPVVADLSRPDVPEPEADWPPDELDGFWTGATAVAGDELLIACQSEDAALVAVTDTDHRVRGLVELPDGLSVEASRFAVDGDRALLGIPHGPGRGSAAYLLERDGAGTWRVSHTFAVAHPWFGVGVAIDGDLIAIGDRDAAGGRGAVMLYERTGDGRWSHTRTIRPPRPVNGFGIDVALRGDRLAVMAPWDAAGDDADHVFVFDLRAAATPLRRARPPS